MTNFNFSDFFKRMKSRNVFKDSTSEPSKFNNQKIVPYIGFDLTGPSLHAGHLMSLILSKRIIDQVKNSYFIFVLGGATTKIGDPSGKQSSRPILSEEEINKNKVKIASNIIKVVHEKYVTEKDLSLNSEVVFKTDKFVILDNDFWLKNVMYLDFLREYGRIFSINQMVKTDIVKTRLDSQSNITFLEFNYALLQGYDFLYLNQNYQCNIQIGGSDQWTNIIQGCNLIKEKSSKEVVGVTTQLLTTQSGSKMGKTESGTIWITESMTSPFDLFQYFRNTSDEDVKKLLLVFSEYEESEIDEMISADINKAKEQLSLLITSICHSEEKAKEAQAASHKLFSGSVSKANAIYMKDKNTELDELLIKHNLVKSKSEIKRLCESNGISIQKQTVSNPKFIINESSILQIDPSCTKDNDGMFFIISVGKKRKYTFCIPNV